MHTQSNFESQNEPTHLYTISLSEAKKNPEYWNVVRHAYETRLARLAAQKFKTQLAKKKGLSVPVEDKQQSSHKNGEPLRFIQEPFGNKADEHAKRIKEGKWLALDFADPQFKRNLFKALRLSKITANEITTSLMLYDAQIQFDTRMIKQHDFIEMKINAASGDKKEVKEEKAGPYTMNMISYAGEKEKIQFNKNLHDIRPSEQCYFSINWSKKFEVALFFDSLQYPGSFDNKTFFNLLKQHIKQLKLEKSLEADFFNSIKILVDNNNLSSEQAAKIKKHLQAQFESWHPEFTDFIHLKTTLTPKLEELKIQKDRQSIKWIALTMKADQMLPYVAQSPDFNEEDPTTPTVCMVFPTVSAFNALQESVHGQDTTYPFPTAGLVTTRFIRELDEHPEKYGWVDQARPAELSHPDFECHDIAHDYLFHDFLLTFHEFIHCWMNGCIHYKPLLRHVNVLLENENGFDMSKDIWTNVDKDLNNNAYRVLELDQTRKSLLPPEFELRHFFLKLIGTVCYLDRKNLTDNTLVLIIDVCKNEEKWRELLQYNGGEKLITILDYPSLHKMQRIIKNYPNQSNKFYILQFHLLSQESFALPAEGINNLVHWTRNSGLKLKDKLLQKFGNHSDLMAAIQASSQEQKDQLKEAEEKFNHRISLLDRQFIFAINDACEMLKKAKLIFHPDSQPRLQNIILEKLIKRPECAIEFAKALAQIPQSLLSAERILLTAMAGKNALLYVSVILESHLLLSMPTSISEYQLAKSTFTKQDIDQFEQSVYRKISNQHWVNALKMAVKNGQSESIVWILENKKFYVQLNQCNINAIFLSAAAGNYLNVLTTLFDADLRPDNEVLNKILQEALNESNLELALFLLNSNKAKNWNIDFQFNFKIAIPNEIPSEIRSWSSWDAISPLCYAVKTNNLALTKALLENGMKPAAANNEFYSFHCLNPILFNHLRNNVNNVREMFYLLLKFGFDFSQSDAYPIACVLRDVNDNTIRKDILVQLKKLMPEKYHDVCMLIITEFKSFISSPELVNKVLSSEGKELIKEAYFEIDIFKQLRDLSADFDKNKLSQWLSRLRLYGFNLPTLLRHYKNSDLTQSSSCYQDVLKILNDLVNPTVVSKPLMLGWLSPKTQCRVVSDETSVSLSLPTDSRRSST